MKKNILIIHYNTPYLTECLVRSINLFVEDAVIYIFDNSDEKPFTAKFNNVTVFDNTKGQIINFDKWLENYPNKLKSGGKANKWGSAKHCYSVEKCMELINGNFVLLDSDVLLKRDISNLFRDDAIYIGEVVTQPNSQVKRVLPFICYINVRLCKEMNVHYFDDNYMHGLWKNGKADRYDTGGALFELCKGKQSIEIKCSNYIVHYGHGSWNKNGYTPQYSANEWLLMNKRFWSMEKNKKVIYTCITGNYDHLLTPKHISSNFDYVCFTDNKDLKSNIWEIRPLPKESEGLSQVKKQRFVKINPHLLLSEYDISIWVDGNVTIKGDLNEFVNLNLKDNCSVFVPQHPSRNCIYSESNIVIRMKKDKADIVKPQMERYRKEGFPEKYGLLQSNIMLRKHNDKGCIKLMETWFDELKKGSHRDQLSFNYALWKNNDVKVEYLDKYIYKSKYFFWNGSHSKTPHQQMSEENYESAVWDNKLGTNKTNKKLKEAKDKFHESFSGNNNRLETHNIPIY